MSDIRSHECSEVTWAGAMLAVLPGRNTPRSPLGDRPQTTVLPLDSLKPNACQLTAPGSELKVYAETPRPDRGLP